MTYFYLWEIVGFEQYCFSSTQMLEKILISSISAIFNGVQKLISCRSSIIMAASDNNSNLLLRMLAAIWQDFTGKCSSCCGKN